MAKVKSTEVEETIPTPVQESVQETVQEIVQPEQVKPTPVAQAPYRAELDESASFEDRVVAFVKSRPVSGFVNINSFLKSMYPVPKFGEKPMWMRQEESKALRLKIANAISSGKLSVNGEHYKLLGSFYYADGNPETQYHNLNTVQIEAKQA